MVVVLPRTLLRSDAKRTVRLNSRSTIRFWHCSRTPCTSPLVQPFEDKGGLQHQAAQLYAYLEYIVAA